MNILVNVQNLGTMAIVNLVIGIILTPLYFIDVLRNPNRKKLLRPFWVFFIIRVIPYPFILLMKKGSLILTIADICILVFLHYYYKNYVEQDWTLFNEVQGGKYKPEPVTDERLKGYGLERETLMRDLFKTYLSIEDANTNQDDTKLQTLCSESMYNRLKKEMEDYQKKNQRNVIKDLNLRSSSLEKIIEKEDCLLIHVKFSVSVCDYVIRKDTGKIVDGEDVPGDYNFFLEFKQNKDNTDSKYILNDMFLI